MPFITQAAAEEALNHLADDFIFIIESAWRDWFEGPFSSQMQKKTVRANLVWNQMLVHAKRRLEGRDGVRVGTLSPWDGILVGNDIFIRMKKADEKLLSRNYPTKSALAFLDQTEDMFGGVVRLELVYLVDKSETSVERIVLLQRHKNSVVWMIDLYGSGEMAQNVIPLSEPPAAPNLNSVAKRIIKPKQNIKDNDQDVSIG